MAVTLSIGVGIKGTSYNENYEQARAAIDLALGRGGDQVVVKNGEDIAYFGGKTKQVERNKMCIRDRISTDIFGIQS